MFSPQEYIDGQLLLVDKPLHWTSHDVVNKVRYFLTRYCKVKKIKVGHSGTLDPLATGLLILATGKKTKELQHFIDLGKTYKGTMTLGAETPSYDLETEPINIKPYQHIKAEQIRETALHFIGVQEQIPPAHSAIKKDGVPLYMMARQGEKTEIKSREVNIKRFDILDIRLPEIDFEIDCSKGTYIRSLAHDFGQHLECGAYLSNLQRTAIGDYLLKDALSVDRLIESLKTDKQQSVD